MTDEITLDAPETRIERFLAAAAGVEGITLDEPVTRIEKYLYKIAQGSGGVPAVEDADKGKYLHANESTGALEWAEGGSGGGRFIVTFSYDSQNETWVSDKTFEECVAAWNDGKTLFANDNNGLIALSTVMFEGESIAYISFYYADAETESMYGFGIDADGVYHYET